MKPKRVVLKVGNLLCIYFMNDIFNYIVSVPQTTGAQILSTGKPDKREVYRSLWKCEFSILNLLHFTPPAPRIIRGVYIFWKFCGPLAQCVVLHGRMMGK